MSLRESSKTSDPESLFLESLPVIERVVSILGNRYGLGESDTEEFSSWVKAKLIDAEYAVFRKFAGRSSLNTYLSVVIANLLKDFRNSRWGRWRPSAIAKRLGPLAVRFETLVYRDGHPPREAIEVLKSKGISESEINGIASRLPARSLVREVTLESVVDASPALDRADAGVDVAEQHDADKRVGETVAAALSQLPAEDQVLLRMRFWDDFSVADIARTLGIEQKPLYRRLESIQASLGALLLERGIGREQVADLLSHEGISE